jgi:hypothetical protein
MGGRGPVGLRESSSRAENRHVRTVSGPGRLDSGWMVGHLDKARMRLVGESASKRLWNSGASLAPSGYLTGFGDQTSGWILIHGTRF